MGEGGETGDMEWTLEGLARWMEISEVILVDELSNKKSKK
jgi:hypothetical protein